MALPTNTPFNSLVRLVQTGEPVDAPTTNRPIGDLAQQTQSLRERLAALESGQQLRIDDMPLQSGMVDGTPVYLAADGVLRPALASMAVGPIGGTVDVTAFVVGVVIQHQSPTLGSIVTQGRILSLSTTQWAQVVSDPLVGGFPVAGHYFLSTVNPGKITRFPGALALYVGQLFPDGSFLVRIPAPQRGEHVHYEFTLSHHPAGTVVDPTYGNPQTIATPNPALQGWLPATTTYFPQGGIPVGAVFGYNLAHANESALAAVFPPIPLNGAMGAQAGILIDDGRLLVNQFGIWWMSNAYGKAPWPVDYAAHGGGATIEFWFSRVLFVTEGGIVTSIDTHPASLLNIQTVDVHGNSKHDGALLLRVDTLLQQNGAAQRPGTSIKSISGNQFVAGPSVDAILAGAGVVITQSVTEPGVFTISAAATDALQGSATVVDLANAREDTISDTQVLVLPVGRVSRPVWNFEISRQAPSQSSLSLKLWLYSSVTGSIPSGSCTLEYRILPPGSSTAVALPTGWTTLAGALDLQPVTAGSYREITTAAIPAVQAGSLVLVRLTRQGLTDGFTGNIGVIRMNFQLT